MLYPESKALVSARIFLLGQISLILSEGKPVQNAERNPSTEVVLNLYEYIAATDSYRANGRTALLKSTSVLHMNVTKQTTESHEGITLAIGGVEELQGYEPYSQDIDIDSRLPTCTAASESHDLQDEDEYIVEKIVKKKI